MATPGLTMAIPLMAQMVAPIADTEIRYTTPRERVGRNMAVRPIFPMAMRMTAITILSIARKPVRRFHLSWNKSVEIHNSDKLFG